MRRGIRAALLALAMACAGSVLAVPPRDRVEAVSAVVDAAAAQGFAGEVLVADAQAIWFERSLGLADRARGLPHRPGALWRWASVSKQVAAALAMQQVDAGRLALEGRVAQYLPGFAAPNAARITVRQLLQHTSGLPNPDDSPGFYQANDAQQGNRPALAFCAGAPRREPGERFEYNNCDTLVLAALLERVTGRPYAALLREQLAMPLGLATLRLVDGAEASPALAYGADGRPLPQPRLARFGAAAALEGTARELLAFDRALLAHRLVSPAATETMWTGEPRLGYVALGAWAFPAPLKGCPEPVTLVERRGSVGGIQVRNVIAPAQGVSVIVFTNLAALAFGEVWQGAGLAHDLLAAALCGTRPGR